MDVGKDHGPDARVPICRGHFGDVLLSGLVQDLEPFPVFQLSARLFHGHVDGMGPAASSHDKDREFPALQPEIGKRLRAVALVDALGHPEVAIPVLCGIHPSMRASIAVFAHPPFAVTGSDGRFEIRYE